MIVPNDSFWKVFKETPGAFSTAEAIALCNICSKVRYDGVGDWSTEYLELGTHKGKSALAAMTGLGSGMFHLVDPIFSDTNIFSELNKTVDRAFRGDKEFFRKCHFNPIAATSIEAIEQLQNQKWFSLGKDGVVVEVPKKAGVNAGTFSYVFVDSGSHSDELPMQEAKMLEDKIVPRGVIAFHDYGSQFTKVDEAFNYLLSTGKFEKIDIDWQPIFDYVKEHDLENGNNSWHQYPELPHPPNFIGALKRK